MVELFIEKKLSKKSERPYFSLYADLGYRKQALTYDVSIICSLCAITEQSLYDSLELDKPMKIGTFDIKFED